MARTQVRLVNLGPLSRIPPGEGRAFRLGGLHVAVFRTREGRVFATQAECPHRQGALANGLIGGATLICPLHAFKFSLETGEALSGECGAIRTYPVAVSPEGDVVLEAEGP